MSVLQAFWNLMGDEAAPNNAVRFGSIAGGITLPPSAAQALGEQLTYEIWLQPAQDETNRRRMDLFATYPFYVWISEVNTSVPGRAGYLEILNSINGSYLPAGWVPNHTPLSLAVVIDMASPDSTQRARAYMNGQLIANGNFNGTGLAGAAKKEIGFLSENGARFYSGLVDEIRIWNVARTGAQITDSYNKLELDDQTGLVGWYDCDDISGNVLRDKSPAQANGVCSGDITSAPSPANYI